MERFINRLNLTVWAVLCLLLLPATSWAQQGTDPVAEVHEPRSLGRVYSDAAGEEVMRFRAAQAARGVPRQGYARLLSIASQAFDRGQSNRPVTERETLTSQAFDDANPCDVMYACRMPPAPARRQRFLIVLNGARSMNGVRTACVYNARNNPDLGNEFVTETVAREYCRRHGAEFYERWDRPNEIYDVPAHLVVTPYQQSVTALRTLATPPTNLVEATSLAMWGLPLLRTVQRGRTATIAPSSTEQVSRALDASLGLLERIGQTAPRAVGPTATQTTNVPLPLTVPRVEPSARERQLEAQVREMERLARTRALVWGSLCLGLFGCCAFFVWLLLRRANRIESLEKALKDLGEEYDQIVYAFNHLGRIMRTVDGKEKEVNLFATFGTYSVMNLRKALSDLADRMQRELQVPVLVPALVMPVGPPEPKAVPQIPVIPASESSSEKATRKDRPSFDNVLMSVRKHGELMRELRAKKNELIRKLCKTGKRVKRELNDAKDANALMQRENTRLSGEYDTTKDQLETSKTEATDYKKRLELRFNALALKRRGDIHPTLMMMYGQVRGIIAEAVSLSGHLWPEKDRHGLQNLADAMQALLVRQSQSSMKAVRTETTEVTVVTTETTDVHQAPPETTKVTVEPQAAPEATDTDASQFEDPPTAPITAADRDEALRRVMNGPSSVAKPAGSVPVKSSEPMRSATPTLMPGPLDPNKKD